MWWKTVLKLAVAVGLDKWAEAKAKSLAEKLLKKAEAKLEQAKVESAELTKVVKGEGEE